MNTKESELIDRFIELRAQGWIFDRLAQELGVSKPTLIAWSRKYQHRIRNLRALAQEALTEECQVSRRVCVANLSDDLQRIRAEIARRDLADIPTARLLVLATRLRAEASRLHGPLHLSESTGTLPPEENQYLEPIVNWEA